MSALGRVPATDPAPRRPGRSNAELRALRALAPYLWPRQAPALRLRVVLAILFLIAGRFINIAVPFLYRHAVDALAPTKTALRSSVKPCDMTRAKP